MPLGLKARYNQTPAHIFSLVSNNEPLTPASRDAHHAILQPALCRALCSTKKPFSPPIVHENPAHRSRPNSMASSSKRPLEGSPSSALYSSSDYLDLWIHTPWFSPSLLAKKSKKAEKWDPHDLIWACIQAWNQIHGQIFQSQVPINCIFSLNKIELGFWLLQPKSCNGGYVFP